MLVLFGLIIPFHKRAFRVEWNEGGPQGHKIFLIHFDEIRIRLSDLFSHKSLPTVINLHFLWEGNYNNPTSTKDVQKPSDGLTSTSPTERHHHLGNSREMATPTFFDVGVCCFVMLWAAAELLPLNSRGFYYIQEHSIPRMFGLIGSTFLIKR